MNRKGLVTGVVLLALTGCGRGGIGEVGPRGADGAAIKVLKLCPGEPVYPSVFIETALLIDERVYAVMSVNGGFLAELPPGNYQSNAIGSRCNFTVTKDHEIKGTQSGNNTHD